MEGSNGKTSEDPEAWLVDAMYVAQGSGFFRDTRGSHFEQAVFYAQP